jgi:HSP20 family molecular chaperone IbpA
MYDKRNGPKDIFGFDSLFRVFDDIFNPASDFWRSPVVEEIPRLQRSLCNSQWPPSNILLSDKTKELRIEVALAGYSENDINLAYDGDQLVLTIQKDDTITKASRFYQANLIQRGVKMPASGEIKWLISPKHYDKSKTDVNFTNGLLSITIQPREDVAPQKIQLFGKVKEAAKEPVKEPAKELTQDDGSKKLEDTEDITTWSGFVGYETPSGSESN